MERGESIAERGAARTLQLDGTHQQPRKWKQARLGAGAEGGEDSRQKADRSFAEEMEVFTLLLKAGGNFEAGE